MKILYAAQFGALLVAWTRIPTVGDAPEFYYGEALKGQVEQNAKALAARFGFEAQIVVLDENYAKKAPIVKRVRPAEVESIAFAGFDAYEAQGREAGERRKMGRGAR